MALLNRCIMKNRVSNLQGAVSSLHCKILTVNTMVDAFMMVSEHVQPKTKSKTAKLSGYGEMNSDDEDESKDQLAPLGIDNDVIEQLMVSKAENPSKFASFWEMDEEDIDEVSQEEIQKNPVLRTLWAAETGKLDVLEEMLESDPSLVNCQDRDGYTPLHRAAYEGHVGVSQFLLNHGAEINRKTVDGWTPLHSASNWGQTDVAALFLRNGACVNAQTTGLQTPLHLAAANADCREILELLLLAEGVEYNLQNKQGETAVEVARRCSRYYFLFDMCAEASNKL